MKLYMVQLLELFAALWLMGAVGFVAGYSYMRPQLAACRAQCSQAVGQLERAVKLNRVCLADLQDAQDTTVALERTRMAKVQFTMAESRLRP